MGVATVPAGGLGYYEQGRDRGGPVRAGHRQLLLTGDAAHWDAAAAALVGGDPAAKRRVWPSASVAVPVRR